MIVAGSGKRQVAGVGLRHPGQAVQRFLELDHVPPLRPQPDWLRSFPSIMIPMPHGPGSPRARSIIPSPVARFAGRRVALMSSEAAADFTPEELYRTGTVLSRELRVHYPVTEGQVWLLRTDADWERDVEAVRVSDDGTCFTFRLEAKRPFLYFKPCLKIGGQSRWAVGANALALLTHQVTSDVYPFFSGPDSGTFSPLIEFDSTFSAASTCFAPTCRPDTTRTPSRSTRSCSCRTATCSSRRRRSAHRTAASPGPCSSSTASTPSTRSSSSASVPGIGWPIDRSRATRPTAPVAEEIVPHANQRLRLIGGRNEIGVIGSSLGGVVSFFIAWQSPDVFGGAAWCSSTFSHRDDSGRPRAQRAQGGGQFYLDSGWPGDNFETTLAMAIALQSRGYRFGQDFMHFAFPHDEHREGAWGRACICPLQLLWGRRRWRDAAGRVGGRLRSLVTVAPALIAGQRHLAGIRHHGCSAPRRRSVQEDRPARSGANRGPIPCMVTSDGLAALVSLVAVALGGGSSVGAQSQARPGASRAWTVPRTPDGQPDLQGIWTNATLTPLERPRALADRAVPHRGRSGRDRGQAAGARPRPTTPSRRGRCEGRRRQLQPVLVRLGHDQVLPTRQTSLVVDPPDGRVPVRPEAEARRDDALSAQHRVARVHERLGSLHLARRARLGHPGRLQQRLPDRADARLRRDPRPR